MPQATVGSGPRPAPIGASGSAARRNHRRVKCAPTGNQIAYQQFRPLFFHQESRNWGQRSGAVKLTPRDPSQLPVEQLAQALLDCARADSRLPRRSPANDNATPIGWLAPPQAQPCRAWLPDRLAPQPRFEGQEQLEALVAQAVTVAQQAEDAAHATGLASRRASRSAAIALAIGVFGTLVGLTGGLGCWFGNDGGRFQAAAADPAQLVVPPPPIDATDPADAAATATPARHARAIGMLPAIAPAAYVRALPAVATPSQQPPFGISRLTSGR